MCPILLNFDKNVIEFSNIHFANFCHKFLILKNIISEFRYKHKSIILFPSKKTLK